MSATFRAVLLALSLLLSAAPSPADPASHSAEQLRQDLRALRDMIANTHPAPAHSVPPGRLESAYADIEARLRAPMTTDEAWRLLATLNPLFADAHLLVGQPDWMGQTAAHLKAGGTLFPYEVQVDAAGEVRIRSELGGAASPRAGARIDRINGVPARDIAAGLLARMHGDTPEFRAHLLSRRWWFFFWKMHGQSASYELLLSQRGNAASELKPASGATPALLTDDADFDRQFKFELLTDGAALLTLNNFHWTDKARYLDFTGRAFAALRDARVSTLIIDIRANGGGNDDMWIDGILRYIADKPYRWASGYRKKVILGRASGTEKVGDVVTGTVDKWVQPEPGHPLRFTGQTYLLVGRSTYSSAILFANVVQDFGFGKVVGGGYARTSQSGGTQRAVLPNTGLIVSAPRLILQRPSGATEPVLLRPDIEMEDDPFDSRAMVDALRARTAR